MFVINFSLDARGAHTVQLSKNDETFQKTDTYTNLALCMQYVPT